jgi:hypothetical protein
MKRRTFSLLSLVLFAATSFGQSGTKTTTAAAVESATEPRALTSTEPEPGDSPLVRAAKANRARNKKSPSTVVLNNDDVRKAKGNLIFITEKPLDPGTVKQLLAPTPRPAGPPTATAADLAAATTRLEAARQEVSDLEKELGRLEEDYYNEDDATYRDQVIESRFAQATRQLQAARQKLLEARDQHQKIEQYRASRRSD